MTSKTKALLCSENGAFKGPCSLKEKMHCKMQEIWEQKGLLDYKVKVEDEVFSAHRIVLASASDFFSALLLGDFKECNDNEIELKAITATGFQALLNYFYTEKLVLEKENLPDILGASVHLQVLPAVEICSDFMKRNLNEENCKEYLDLAKLYHLNTAEKIIWNYISRSPDSTISKWLKDETMDDVMCLIENWQASHFSLLTHVQAWISSNLDDRRQYTDKLMSYIDLSLFSKGQLDDLLSSNAFMNNTASEEFRDNVMEFSQIPVWQKVLRRSSAFERGEKTLVAFSILQARTEDGDWLESPYKYGSVLHMLETDEENADGIWYTLKVPDENSKIIPARCSVTLINNYLVVAGGREDVGRITNKCYVFDPRLMTWSSLGDMKLARKSFPLVAKEDRLFALGGTTNGAYGELTRKCEVFNFQTNTWSPFKSLPKSLRCHAACYYKNMIWVCGGHIVSEYECPTDEVFCLDLSTNKWIKKSPMKLARFKHRLTPMTLRKMEVLVAVGGTDEAGTIEYYDLQQDTWSLFQPNLPYSTIGRIQTDYEPDGVNCITNNKNVLYSHGRQFRDRCTTFSALTLDSDHDVDDTNAEDDFKKLPQLLPRVTASKPLAERNWRTDAGFSIHILGLLSLPLGYKDMMLAYDV